MPNFLGYLRSNDNLNHLHNSHRRPPLLNPLQLPLPIESLRNLRLFTQHKPIRLFPNFRQSPPPFKILWIPLVAVSFLWIVPMAFSCRSGFLVLWPIVLGRGVLGEVA